MNRRGSAFARVASRGSLRMSKIDRGERDTDAGQRKPDDVEPGCTDCQAEQYQHASDDEGLYGSSVLRHRSSCGNALNGRQCDGHTRGVVGERSVTVCEGLPCVQNTAIRAGLTAGHGWQGFELRSEAVE